MIIGIQHPSPLRKGKERQRTSHGEIKGGENRLAAFHGDSEKEQERRKWVNDPFREACQEQIFTRGWVNFQQTQQKLWSGVEDLTQRL